MAPPNNPRCHRPLQFLTETDKRLKSDFPEALYSPRGQSFDLHLKLNFGVPVIVGYYPKDSSTFGALT